MSALGCNEDDCDNEASTVCMNCGVMLCDEHGGGVDVPCGDCGEPLVQR